MCIYNYDDYTMQHWYIRGFVVYNDNFYNFLTIMKCYLINLTNANGNTVDHTA